MCYCCDLQLIRRAGTVELVQVKNRGKTYIVRRVIAEVIFTNSRSDKIFRCARPSRDPGRAPGSGFIYAIRNIVAEARKVEAAGRKVRYLNIGDPVIFGFQTPPHMIEAVERAMRDGHNGYAPSVGILAGARSGRRRADRRGMPVSADRVVITSGTSEGIELALTALAESGRRGADPVADLSALYRGAREDRRAAPCSIAPIPRNGWLPDVDEVAQPGDARDPRARRHRSEQSDRRDLSGGRAPRR